MPGGQEEEKQTWLESKLGPPAVNDAKPQPAPSSWALLKLAGNAHLVGPELQLGLQDPLVRINRDVGCDCLGQHLQNMESRHRYIKVELL